MPHAEAIRLLNARRRFGQRGWVGLAGLAYVAELLLFTCWRGQFGPFGSPALFIASGLLLCAATLRVLRDQPVAQAPAPQVAQRVGWGWLAWLLGGALVLSRQVPVVLRTPVDVRMSDVIPSVQTYVERFRSGEVVYRYFTNLPYPLFPTYLPLQWLPYVPLQAKGIDFRWLSLALLLLPGFGSYQLAVLRQPSSGWAFGLKALLPGFVLWLMVRTDDLLFAHVVEPAVIGYYFLLAASVLSRSAWAQGGALVLCLLSRYSVVLWVPFYLVVLWRGAGRRHALLVAGLVLAGIVGLYVVPFLAKDPTIFLHGLAEYRIAALGEWSRSEGVGGHLFNGLSAAPWLYTYLDMPLTFKITWVQRLHLVASGAAVAVLAWFYGRYGRRYDYRYLALVGLKFYLAIFYFFIQVPYAYLISLSVLLSVFLVSLVLSTPHKALATKELSE